MSASITVRQGRVIESRAPKQTKYRLGRSFEYRCRDFFRKYGYFVLRSPRSGGPVDLVAIKPKMVVFIQCKYGGIFGVKEWNEFYRLAISVEALPILASMKPEGRGIDLKRIIGIKDGSKRKQPMEEWKITS